MEHEELWNDIYALRKQIQELKRRLDGMEYTRLPEVIRDVEYRLESQINRLQSDIDSVRRGY